MKKLLCWVTAAALFAFIAASLGGCGGSSKEISGGGQTSEEKSAEERLAGELSGDMASVYGKDEYTKMYDEFRESGSFDKMNPMKWVFCIPEDRAEEMLEEEENELARALLQELLFDADSVKEAYDKEETILLFYPDESFINRTLDAVGLVGSYVLTPEEAPDGRLELFAVAKRTVNDRTHTFTYHAACSDAFRISDDLSAPSTEGGNTDTVVSGDKAYVVDENGNIISSSDVETGNKKEAEYVGENTEPEEFDISAFSVERWRNYYNWAASLTDWAKEKEVTASAIEVHAAANELLTSISESQTETLDFSIARNGYQPWGNINGCDTVNINRTNSMSFTIYSCHSYTSGSDYYLVKQIARTRTNYYQDRVLHFKWGDDSFNKDDSIFSGNMGGHQDPVNYLSGFTKAIQPYAFIYRNKNRNDQPSVPEIGLLDTTPKNVARQTDYSTTMGWNLSGTIGGNKDGASGQISGGVSYSETKSFSKKSYNITNASDSTVATWNLGYDGITEGSWHVDGLYQGIWPPDQSTENVEFESAWIWEVRKSVWGREGKTLNMGLDFWSQEGFAFGHGKSNIPIYHWDNQERYPWFENKKTIVLRAPAHFWLSQRTFSFPKDVSNYSMGAKSFEILAEYDWTVSTDANWIHLSTTSGKATGPDKYEFMFEVDNNNTGKMRSANIKFKMSYNGNIEEKDIQVSQASK